MQTRLSPLHTDLYQITMAQAYWKLGMADVQAAFNLFYRENPFQGGYAICSGLAAVSDFIEQYCFLTEELDYLAILKSANGEPLFLPAFLDYLASLKLSIDLDAIPEGTVVFPKLPLLCVRGSVLQCQLMETTLLNLINFATLIATKAARVCWAAAGDSVVEFGLRRSQGVDGGFTATRAAFVGGVGATSNVLAGQKWGIPVRGTHAHSWIMAFDTEKEAFEAYAKAMPHNAIFLVDTYNSLEGVQHAIEVGKRLTATGHAFSGIRLDSGDLASLSIAARKMLDEAGFKNTHIMGSGDLDEYEILRLKQAGAKLSVWGVGTRLVTGYDQPALGGVYKLVAIQDANGVWKNKAKRSDDPKKQTMPGRVGVRRQIENGFFARDIVYAMSGGGDRPEGDRSEDDRPEGDRLDGDQSGNNRNDELLLQPIFRRGKRIAPLPSLQEIQDKTKSQLKQLPDAFKTLKPAEIYPVVWEDGSACR